MNDREIESLVEEMASGIRSRLQSQNIKEPLMVGIHTGGAWIAGRLHRLLGLSEPLGTLDISFYRDDFTRIGINPQVRPSSVPFSLDDRHIILVDDVLQSGRTIRAAMNELFDYGRPASIMLAVLVERSGRELPIQPAVVGTRPPLKPKQHITLTGPDPLALVIGESKSSAREGTA